MMTNNNNNDDESVLSIMTEESINSTVLREVLAITSDGLHHEVSSSRSSTDDDAAVVAPMNTISSESNNSLLQTPTRSGSEEIKTNESDANLSVMLDAMLLEGQSEAAALLAAVLDEAAFAPAAADDADDTAIDDTSNNDDNIVSVVTEDCCPSLAPTESTISVATERASLYPTPSNDERFEKRVEEVHAATAAQASAEYDTIRGTQKLDTTTTTNEDVSSSSLMVSSPIVLQDGTTTVSVTKTSQDESPEVYTPLEEAVPSDDVVLLLQVATKEDETPEVYTPLDEALPSDVSEEVSLDNVTPTKITVSEQQPDVPIADDIPVEANITASSPPEATLTGVIPEHVVPETIAPAVTDTAFVTLGIVSNELDASMLPTTTCETSKPATTKPPRTKSLSMKKLQFGSIKSLVKNNDPISVPSALSTIRKSIPSSPKGFFGMKKYNNSRTTTTTSKAPSSKNESKNIDSIEKDCISSTTELINSIQTNNAKVLAAIALMVQDKNDVRTKLETEEDDENRKEECRDDTEAIIQLSNNDIEEKSVSAVEDESTRVTEEYTAMPTTVMDGMNDTINDNSLSVEDEYNAIETVMDESNDTIKDQSLCNLDDMALGITARATILGAIVGDAVNYVVNGFSGQNIEGQTIATVYPDANETVNELDEFVESANERLQLDDPCDMISKDETKEPTETQAMVVPHTDLAAKKLLAMEKVTKRTAVKEINVDNEQVQDYPINCCIELKLIDNAIERLNARMKGQCNAVKLTSAANEEEEVIVIPAENGSGSVDEDVKYETPHMIGLKNSSEFETVEDEIPIVEESIIDEIAKLDEESLARGLETAEKDTNEAASPTNICVEQSIPGFMIDASNAVSVLNKAFNESLTGNVGNISTKENDDGNIEILASDSITTIPIIAEDIITTKEALGLDEVYVSSPACNPVEPAVNVGDGAALSPSTLQNGEEEKQNTVVVKRWRFKSLSSIKKLQKSSGLIGDDDKASTNITEDIHSKVKVEEQCFDKDDVKASMADIDEITSLVKVLSLPKSADKMMLEKYKGREGLLLANLKKMKNKQTSNDKAKADESEAITAEITSLNEVLSLPKSGDEMLTEYKGREDELLKNLKLTATAEITNLTTKLSLPKSADKMLKKYKGREGGLLANLKKMKAKQTNADTSKAVENAATIAEITSLIKELSLPKSSEEMLTEYEGREHDLLKNLKLIKDKQQVADSGHDNVQSPVTPVKVVVVEDVVPPTNHNESENVKPKPAAPKSRRIKSNSMKKLFMSVGLINNPTKGKMTGTAGVSKSENAQVRVSEETVKNDNTATIAEITSLITDLSLPKSADKMLEKYKGREEELLTNLRKMKANQAEDDISTNVEKVATIAEITSLIEELSLPKSVDEMLTNYKGREGDLLKNLKLIEVIDVVMEDAVSSTDVNENKRERSRPAMLSMDFSGSLASDQVYDKEEKQAKSVEIDELSNTNFTERNDKSWTRNFLDIKDKIENYISTTAKSISDLDKMCGATTSIESDSDSIWPEKKTTSMQSLSITSQTDELNEIQAKLEQQRSAYAEELKKIENESQQENKLLEAVSKAYAEQLMITKDEYSKESMAYKMRINDLKSKCEVLAQVARVKCETLKSLAQQTKEEAEQTINAQAAELETMRAVLKIIGVDSTVGQQSFESTQLQQVESIEVQELGPRLPPSVTYYPKKSKKSVKSLESFPETAIDRSYPKRPQDVREIEYDCVSDDSSTNASYSTASTHSDGEGSWLTKFSLFWSKKEERDEVNERDNDSGLGDNRIFAL